MKVAVFNTKSYDRQFLSEAAKNTEVELDFFKVQLSEETYKIAEGYEALCVFVNDRLHRDMLKELAANGTKLIALRCSGFNNVDLKAAAEFGIKIARVPAYSPQGVAEHAVALMLALNRKIYRAHNRIRENNFSLEGLLGFEISGLNVGVVGTGAIGRVLIKIMLGFGARVLAYDPFPNNECVRMGAEYVELEELFKRSDIISLHTPLLKETYHLVNADTIELMKTGVMLINTSRGALIDARAVIDGLKSGKIGYLGLDVYEEEEKLFFEDLSGEVLKDDVFARLTTFPNVMLTAHQAFFTKNALSVIAQTTINNIIDYAKGELKASNEVVFQEG